MNAPTHPAAVAAPVRADILELQRILRERDESRDFALAHATDDTHRPAGLLSCGCAPEHGGKPCAWHSHVAEALDDARDIVTSRDTIGPWAVTWTAVRTDYDGGDPADPSGHGATEQAAIDDLREQEGWRAEDREARRVA